MIVYGHWHSLWYTASCLSRFRGHFEYPSWFLYISKDFQVFISYLSQLTFTSIMALVLILYGMIRCIPWCHRFYSYGIGWRIFTALNIVSGDIAHRTNGVAFWEASCHRVVAQHWIWGILSRLRTRTHLRGRRHGRSCGNGTAWRRMRFADLRRWESGDPRFRWRTVNSNRIRSRICWHRALDIVSLRDWMHCRLATLIWPSSIWSTGYGPRARPLPPSLSGQCIGSDRKESSCSRNSRMDRTGINMGNRIPDSLRINDTDSIGRAQAINEPMDGPMWMTHILAL